MSGRTAIVVEGGAMRGVFSAGVLDAFLEGEFHPFDLAVGVSAGACNLASHLAGQHGRNKRCYLELMSRRDFIDVRRAVRGGSIVDLDWLWDALAAKEPLDVAAIARQKTEFVVVATSALTGDPVHLVPGEADMFDALKGSCALPVLYRRAVKLHGDVIVDGGVSDPIPAEAAYRRGARRIVVIRSRPANFFKVDSLSDRLTSLALFRDPGVMRAVRKTAERYQRAVEFLTSPPKDCTLIQIAPEVPLATSRMSQDIARLTRDYALGHELGRAAIQRWDALIASPP
jgi:predicted patatin/cPLA2 family phospholipase